MVGQSPMTATAAGPSPPCVVLPANAVVLLELTTGKAHYTIFWEGPSILKQSNRRCNHNHNASRVAAAPQLSFAHSRFN